METTGRRTEEHVHLRGVIPGDVLIFYQQQSDPAAYRMAAFMPADHTDRDAYMERWVRWLDDEKVMMRSIVFHSRVAGHVLSYLDAGRREVSFWIGRSFWGRGIATAALRQFVAEESARPLFARAAADNTASIRVLEKSGFAVIEAATGFAHGRGEETPEVILRLD